MKKIIRRIINYIKSGINRIYYIHFNRIVKGKNFYTEKEKYIFDNRDFDFYKNRPSSLNLIEFSLLLYKSFNNKLPKTLLDAGCNIGHILKIFASKYPQMIFTGYDINPDIVSYNIENNIFTNLYFKAVDLLDNANLPENKFDIITCFDVIEHISKRDSIKMLMNLQKLLSDDGFLLIVTPRGHASDDGHYHMQFFTLKLLEKIVRDSFEIMYSGNFGYNPILKKNHEDVFVLLKRK